MSGSPAIRALYDLLLYWAAALIAAMLGTPTRIPPLLFYLVFGAILGNFNIVERGEGIEFFAEWAITVVFFSLGFEETVEHFLEGVRKAWGIALIGALVPFGCGYLSGYIFWPELDWKVHLTIATAVTATAVSLTMIVLQSVGLLKSRSSMGIMTSAVLDDVGCLILVAILIPIIVSANQQQVTYSPITPSPCATVDANVANITATLQFSSASSLASYDANATLVAMLREAVRTDVMNLTNVPSHLISVAAMSLHPSFNATLLVHPSSSIGLSAQSFRFFLDSGIRSQALVNGNFWTTSAALEHATGSRVTSARATVPNSDPPAVAGVKAVDIVWIIVKVIIFFIIIVFLHNVVLPHDIKTGPIACIPGVRSYGIKHLLQLFGGVQVPLMIVTFGLGLGMVGAALGFHPAVGAYFAGLLLEEEYFDLEVPAAEAADAQAKEATSPKADSPTGPGKGRQYIASKNTPLEEEDDLISEPETPNTMEHAKDTVGSASFMWLGPVFFVHLGSGLEIQASLLATAIPQALGIFAILWVGQFISATVSARYVPGGFDWVESALVGFGMLGRAELYFVVLNIAKTEGIFDNSIFFPMAVAAMFMNITLPIAISAFKPVYAKYHPEDVAGAKPVEGTGEAIVVPPTPEEEERPHKRRSAISRRGIGLATIEIDPESEQLATKPPMRQASRLSNRSPSRQSSRLSRGGSRLGRRTFDDTDYFAEMPEMPAHYAGREPHTPGPSASPTRSAAPASPTTAKQTEKQ